MNLENDGHIPLRTLFPSRDPEIQHLTNKSLRSRRSLKSRKRSGVGLTLPTTTFASLPIPIKMLANVAKDMKSLRKTSAPLTSPPPTARSAEPALNCGRHVPPRRGT